MTRCFTFIEDACDCIIKIFNNKKTYSEVFNVGSNKENSILEVKKIFEKIHKDKIKFNFIDTKKLYQNKYEDILGEFLESIKLSKIGWKAKTSLEEGIKKLTNFIKKCSINSQHKIEMKKK